MTNKIPTTPPEFKIEEEDDVKEWHQESAFLDAILYDYTTDTITELPYSVFHRTYSWSFVTAKSDEEMDDALAHWVERVSGTTRLQVKVYDDVKFKETGVKEIKFIVPPLFVSIKPAPTGYSIDKNGQERTSFYTSLLDIQSVQIKNQQAMLRDHRFRTEPVEEDTLSKIWKQLWIEILIYEEMKFIEEGLIKKEDSTYWREVEVSDEKENKVSGVDIPIEETEWEEDED